jgi:hypothetical protein
MRKRFTAFTYYLLTTAFTPRSSPRAQSRARACRTPRVGTPSPPPMRLLVLLLASASALMPTADGMSGARPLVRAPALGRPRPAYRLPPSQLCADAGAVQPLPPAPVSRWQQVVGSGSWRVGAVTALICLDILCYSFPMPFMPEFLASRCATRTRPASDPSPHPGPTTAASPSLRARLHPRVGATLRATPPCCSPPSPLPRSPRVRPS